VIKNIIFRRPIAIALLLAFMLQDVVFANPDICRPAASSNTLAPGNLFTATTPEDILIGELKLTSTSILRMPDRHLFIPIKGSRLRLDLHINPEDEEAIADAAIVKCVILGGEHPVFYKAVVPHDKGKDIVLSPLKQEISPRPQKAGAKDIIAPAVNSGMEPQASPKIGEGKQVVPAAPAMPRPPAAAPAQPSETKIAPSDIRRGVPEGAENETDRKLRELHANAPAGEQGSPKDALPNTAGTPPSAASQASPETPKKAQQEPRSGSASGDVIAAAHRGTVTKAVSLATRIRLIKIKFKAGLYSFIKRMAVWFIMNWWPFKKFNGADIGTAVYAIGNQIHGGMGTENPDSTYAWAMEAGFDEESAAIIAASDMDVDWLSILFLTAPKPLSFLRRFVPEWYLRRHYNRPKPGETADTRDSIANEALNDAIRIARDSNNCFDPRALIALGRGLHSLQDKAAHGDRDLSLDRIEWDSPKVDDVDTNGKVTYGNTRLTEVKELTIEYLEAYLNAVKVNNNAGFTPRESASKFKVSTRTAKPETSLYFPTGLENSGIEKKLEDSRKLLAAIEKQGKESFPKHLRKSDNTLWTDIQPESDIPSYKEMLAKEQVQSRVFISSGAVLAVATAFETGNEKYLDSASSIIKSEAEYGLWGMHQTDARDARLSFEAMMRSYLRTCEKSEARSFLAGLLRKNLGNNGLVFMITAPGALKGVHSARLFHEETPSGPAKDIIAVDGRYAAALDDLKSLYAGKILGLEYDEQKLVRIAYHLLLERFVHEAGHKRKGEYSDNRSEEERAINEIDKPFLLLNPGRKREIDELFDRLKNYKGLIAIKRELTAKNRFKAISSGKPRAIKSFVKKTHPAGKSDALTMADQLLQSHKISLSVGSESRDFHGLPFPPRDLAKPDESPASSGPTAPRSSPSSIMPKGAFSVYPPNVKRFVIDELSNLNKPRMRVIDLGCGADMYLAGQIKLAFTGSEICGIDLPAPVRRHAGTADVKYMQGSMIDLMDGLGSSSFDAVICNFVLPYLSADEKKKVLEQAKRILSPGGKIIIVLHHPASGLAELSQWNLEALSIELQRMVAEMKDVTSRIDKLRAIVNRWEKATFFRGIKNPKKARDKARKELVAAVKRRGEISKDISSLNFSINLQRNVLKHKLLSDETEIKKFFEDENGIPVSDIKTLTFDNGSNIPLAYGVVLCPVMATSPSASPAPQPAGKSGAPEPQGGTPDGYIMQGKEALTHMLKNIGQKDYEDATREPQIIADIDAIKKLTGYQSIEEALGSGRPVRIFVTNAVIRSADDFSFGFFSHASKVREQIEAIIGPEGFQKMFPETEPTFVLAADILVNPNASLRRDYILHELLCHKGHYKAIFEQQRWYPNNYGIQKTGDRRYMPGFEGDETKPFKGILGEYLRESIVMTTRNPLMWNLVHDIKNKLSNCSAFCIAIQKKDPLKKGLSLLDEESEYIKEKIGEFFKISHHIEKLAGNYLGEKGSLDDLLYAINDRIADFIRIRNSIESWMEERSLPEGRLKKDMEIILEESTIAIENMNSLIHWLNWPVEKVEVKRFLRDAVENANRIKEVTDKGIQVKYDETEGIKYEGTAILTYRPVLAMAIYEFVKNAARHSGCKNVTVTAELTSTGELKVAVRDDGKGMARKTLEKLFKEAFDKAAGVSESTGHGLLSLKSAIDSVGGNVKVLSVAEDKADTKSVKIKKKTVLELSDGVVNDSSVIDTKNTGSRFIFTLPVNGPINTCNIPRMADPQVVVLSGNMGSGRRTVAHSIAARLGLRYVNAGFILRAALYYFIKEKMEKGCNEKEFAAYFKDFISRGRLDYSDEPVKIDGIDTTVIDKTTHLSLRDEITILIDRFEGGKYRKLLDEVVKQQGVQETLKEFIRSLARSDGAKSGKYNGIVLRATDPIINGNINAINIELNAPTYIRALRKKQEIGRIEELDLLTGRKERSYPPGLVYKIDTSYIPVREVVDNAVEHILLNISVEDGYLRKGERAFRQMVGDISVIAAREDADKAREDADKAREAAAKAREEAVMAAEHVIPAAREFRHDLILGHSGRAEILKRLESAGIPYPKTMFPIIIRSSVLGKKEFCLGFYSHEPGIKERLIKYLGGEKEFKKMFGDGAIVLSEDVIRRSKEEVLAEYIFRIIAGAGCSYPPSPRLETVLNEVVEEICSRNANRTDHSELERIYPRDLTRAGDENWQLDKLLDNAKAKLTTIKEISICAVIKAIIVIQTTEAPIAPYVVYKMKNFLDMKAVEILFKQNLPEFNISDIKAYLDGYFNSIRLSEDSAELTAELRRKLNERGLNREYLGRIYEIALRRLASSQMQHLFGNFVTPISRVADRLTERYPAYNAFFISIVEGCGSISKRLKTDLYDKRPGEPIDLPGILTATRIIAVSMKGEVDRFSNEKLQHMPRDENLNSNIEQIAGVLNEFIEMYDKLLAVVRQDIAFEEQLERIELVIGKYYLKTRKEVRISWLGGMKPLPNRITPAYAGEPIEVTASVWVQGFTSGELGDFKIKDFLRQFVEVEIWTDMPTPSNLSNDMKAIPMEYTGRTIGTEGHDYEFKGIINTESVQPGQYKVTVRGRTKNPEGNSGYIFAEKTNPRCFDSNAVLNLMPARHAPPASLFGRSRKIALGVAPWVEELARLGAYYLGNDFYGSAVAWAFLGVFTALFISVHYLLYYDAYKAAYIDDYKEAHSGRAPPAYRLFFGILRAPLLTCIASTAVIMATFFVETFFLLSGTQTQLIHNIIPFLTNWYMHYWINEYALETGRMPASVINPSSGRISSPEEGRIARLIKDLAADGKRLEAAHRLKEIHRRGELPKIDVRTWAKDCGILMNPDGTKIPDAEDLIRLKTDYGLIDEDKEKIRARIGRMTHLELLAIAKEVYKKEPTKCPLNLDIDTHRIGRPQLVALLKNIFVPDEDGTIFGSFLTRIEDYEDKTIFDLPICPDNINDSEMFRAFLEWFVAPDGRAPPGGYFELAAENVNIANHFENPHRFIPLISVISRMLYQGQAASPDDEASGQKAEPGDQLQFGFMSPDASKAPKNVAKDGVEELGEIHPALKQAMRDGYAIALLNIVFKNIEELFNGDVDTIAKNLTAAFLKETLSEDGRARLQEYLKDAGRREHLQRALLTLQTVLKSSSQEPTLSNRRIVVVLDDDPGVKFDNDRILSHSGWGIKSGTRTNGTIFLSLTTLDAGRTDPEGLRCLLEHENSDLERGGHVEPVGIEKDAIDRLWEAVRRRGGYRATPEGEAPKPPILEKTQIELPPPDFKEAQAAPGQSAEEINAGSAQLKELLFDAKGTKAGGKYCQDARQSLKKFAHLMARSLHDKTAMGFIQADLKPDNILAPLEAQEFAKEVTKDMDLGLMFFARKMPWRYTKYFFFTALVQTPYHIRLFIESEVKDAIDEEIKRRFPDGLPLARYKDDLARSITNKLFDFFLDEYFDSLIDKDAESGKENVTAVEVLGRGGKFRAGRKAVIKELIRKGPSILACAKGMDEFLDGIYGGVAKEIIEILNMKGSEKDSLFWDEKDLISQKKTPHERIKAWAAYQDRKLGDQGDRVLIDAGCPQYTLVKAILANNADSRKIINKLLPSFSYALDKRAKFDDLQLKARLLNDLVKLSLFGRSGLEKEESAGIVSEDERIEHFNESRNNIPEKLFKGDKNKERKYVEDLKLFLKHRFGIFASGGSSGIYNHYLVRRHIGWVRNDIPKYLLLSDRKKCGELAGFGINVPVRLELILRRMEPIPPAYESFIKLIRKMSLAAVSINCIKGRRQRSESESANKADDKDDARIFNIAYSLAVNIVRRDGKAPAIDDILKDVEDDIRFLFSDTDTTGGIACIKKGLSDIYEDLKKDKKEIDDLLKDLITDNKERDGILGLIDRCIPIRSPDEEPYVFKYPLRTEKDYEIGNADNEILEAYKKKFAGKKCDLAHAGYRASMQDGFSAVTPDKIVNLIGGFNKYIIKEYRSEALLLLGGASAPEDTYILEFPDGEQLYLSEDIRDLLLSPVDRSALKSAGYSERLTRLLGRLSGMFPGKEAPEPQKKRNFLLLAPKNDIDREFEFRLSARKSGQTLLGQRYVVRKFSQDEIDADREKGGRREWDTFGALQEHFKRQYIPMDELFKLWFGNDLRAGLLSASEFYDASRAAKPLPPKTFIELIGKVQHMDSTPVGTRNTEDMAIRIKEKRNPLKVSQSAIIRRYLEARTEFIPPRVISDGKSLGGTAIFRLGVHEEKNIPRDWFNYCFLEKTGQDTMKAEDIHKPAIEFMKRRLMEEVRAQKKGEGIKVKDEDVCDMVASIVRFERDETCKIRWIDVKEELLDYMLHGLSISYKAANKIIADTKRLVQEAILKAAGSQIPNDAVPGKVPAKREKWEISKPELKALLKKVGMEEPARLLGATLGRLEQLIDDRCHEKIPDVFQRVLSKKFPGQLRRIRSSFAKAAPAKALYKVELEALLKDMGNISGDLVSRIIESGEFHIWIRRYIYKFKKHKISELEIAEKIGVPCQTLIDWSKEMSRPDSNDRGLCTMIAKVFAGLYQKISSKKMLKAIGKPGDPIPVGKLPPKRNLAQSASSISKVSSSWLEITVKPASEAKGFNIVGGTLPPGRMNGGLKRLHRKLPRYGKEPLPDPAHQALGYNERTDLTDLKRSIIEIAKQFDPASGDLNKAIRDIDNAVLNRIIGLEHIMNGAENYNGPGYTKEYKDFARDLKRLYSLRLIMRMEGVGKYDAKEYLMFYRAVLSVIDPMLDFRGGAGNGLFDNFERYVPRIELVMLNIDEEVARYAEGTANPRLKKLALSLGESLKDEVFYIMYMRCFYEISDIDYKFFKTRIDRRDDRTAIAITQRDRIDRIAGMFCSFCTNEEYKRLISRKASFAKNEIAKQLNPEQRRQPNAGPSAAAAGEGCIMQGPFSEAHTLDFINEIREKDVNKIDREKYRERIKALANFILTNVGKIELQDEGNRATLDVNLKILSGGQGKIYGFQGKKYIVNKNDFFLGTSLLYPKEMPELFLATDLINELDKLGSEIGNEYIVHEILCRIISHDEAIRVQKQLFKSHYNKDVWPPKGVLGMALRKFIDEHLPKDPALAAKMKRSIDGLSDYHYCPDIPGMVIILDEIKKSFLENMDNPEVRFLGPSLGLRYARLVTYYTLKGSRDLGRAVKLSESAYDLFTISPPTKDRKDLAWSVIEPHTHLAMLLLHETNPKINEIELIVRREHDLFNSNSDGAFMATVSALIVSIYLQLASHYHYISLQYRNLDKAREMLDAAYDLFRKHADARRMKAEAHYIIIRYIKLASDLWAQRHDMAPLIRKFNSHKENNIVALFLKTFLSLQSNEQGAVQRAEAFSDYICHPRFRIFGNEILAISNDLRRCAAYISIMGDAQTREALTPLNPRRSQLGFGGIIDIPLSRILQSYYDQRFAKLPDGILTGTTSRVSRIADGQHPTAAGPGDGDFVGTTFPLGPMNEALRGLYANSEAPLPAAIERAGQGSARETSTKILSKAASSAQPTTASSADIEVKAQEFLRAINKERELTNNIQDEVLSNLVSGRRLILEFNENVIKAGGDGQLSLLVKSLKKWRKDLWDNNEDMRGLLDRFVIQEYSNIPKLRENLQTEEARGKRPEDNGDTWIFIFTQPPKSENDDEKIPKDLGVDGANIRPVYMENLEMFGSDSYLPLFEVAAITLAKELVRWSIDDVKKALAARSIELKELGIGEISIDEKTGILVFKLLPTIKKYEPGDMASRYSRIIQFLHSA